MIGSASTIRPIVEGMVIRNARRIPLDNSLRNEVMLPAAAMRASNGRATVPSATPKYAQWQLHQSKSNGQPERGTVTRGSTRRWS